MSKQQENRNPTSGRSTTAMPSVAFAAWDSATSMRSGVSVRRHHYAIKAGLLTASLTLMAWMVYLTTWYQPVEQPLWAIVAESYATNLLVPHNIPSVNSASKLAELLEHSSQQTLSRQPAGLKSNSNILLERLDTLIPALQKSQLERGSSGYFLLHISAHGLVDENGPFLLKDWASNTTEGFAPPQEKDKIRIRALLHEVIENANGQPAVVVLECENTDSFKELGIWGNKFTESVLEMESWIENQPNLVVILTTDKAQINCKDTKADESLFGRIWREELSDETHLGNTFNLLQLHQAVAGKVAEEAARRFGILQKPVLLPRGYIGDTRAALVKLVSLSPATVSSSNLASFPLLRSWKQRLGIGVEPEAQTTERSTERLAISDTISQIWNKYDRLDKARPHPATFKPNAWAVYKAAALRLEELTFERSFSSAAQIEDLMRPLQAKLEKTASIPPLFIQPSMAFSEFYLSNEDKKVPQWLLTLFEYQWKKSDQDIAKAIASISDQYDKQSLQSIEINQRIKAVEPKKDNIQSMAPKPGEQLNQKSTSDSKDQKPGQPGDHKDSQERTAEKPETKTAKGNDKQEAKPEQNLSITKTSDQKPTEQTNPATNNTPKSARSTGLNPQLRFWLLQLVIDKIRSEATKEISRAMEWVQQIIPANEVLPLELQIVGLASRDLNRIGAENYTTIGHDSVVNFIDLIVASERAFAGLSDNFESQTNFFNHTYFWIRPWTEKAESTFLKSWDYIFSPDASKRNEGLLIQRDAKLQYNSILSRAANIQKTLEAYYSSIERLPELSFWMVRSNLIDHTNEIHGGKVQSFDRIVKAWDCIREITKILENERNDKIPLATRDLMIRDITAKGIELNGHVESIENHYMQICRNLVNRADRDEFDPITATRIRHALKIAPRDIDLRKSLVNTFLNLNDRLESETTAQEPDESSDLLFDIASSLCQNLQELQYNLAGEETVLLRYNPSNIKRLHDELVSESKVFFHPLRALEQEFTALNQSLSKSEIELNTRVSWTLDHLTRVLPLSMVPDTNDHVISEIHSILTSDHLRLFAERIWKCHWGAIQETAVPYYKKICFSLVEEARRLAPDRLSGSSQFQVILDLLKSPSLPEIQLPDHIEVTGEPSFMMPIQIRPHPGQTQPQGFASVLIQISSPVEIDPNAGSAQLFQINLPSALEIPFQDLSWESSERNPNHSAGLTRSPIKFGFLFRGNYFEKVVTARITHLPDSLDLRNLPPKGGTFAVRCEPELMEKLGKSTGHVVFLLDCSGSMGVNPGAEWNPDVKYEQAVKSVLETVSQLPDGTNISVWVFGEAVGELKSADPQSTIRQVVPFMKWDSTDRNALNRLRSQIAYPACEPWNKSPILLAMEQAKASLVPFKGPKAMIVITDGQDNIYGKDPENSPNQLNRKQTQQSSVDFTRAIRTIFAESGISVNVVGFKLKDQEQLAVEEQFSVVRDLGTPGVFAMVKDTRELTNTLGSILRRKLVYRFESDSPESFSSENIEGTEIQPIGAAIQWASPALPQNVYKIWMDAGTRIETRYFIKDGQRNLLKLVYNETQDQLAFERDSWLLSDFSWRPQVASQGWRMCWIGSRTVPGQLQILVGLEKEPHDPLMPMASNQYNPEPVDLQWLIRPIDVVDPSLDVEIRRAWNYPANVWQIVVHNWSPTMKMPSIGCLIQPGRPFDTNVTLFAGTDYFNESDLKGKTLDTDLIQLRIEKVEKQQRWLPDTDLVKNKRQSCWVIRTRQDPLKQTRADFEFADSSPRVVEYRSFSQASISETIVWQLNDSESTNDLKMPHAIRFRPLQHHVRKPDSNAILLELRDNLPRPAANDPWPVPIDLPANPANVSNRNSRQQNIPPALTDEIKPNLVSPSANRDVP